MKIEPGRGKLLTIPQTESKTASGIFIPDTAGRKNLVWGKVLAIGEAIWIESGKTKPVDYKINDVVLYEDYSATKIELNGVEHHIVDTNQIAAKQAK